MNIHQPFKTHCIGRFLIDLPEEFHPILDSIDGLGSAELFYGMDENFQRIYIQVPKQRSPEVEPVLLREEFNRAVRDREHELHTEKNVMSGLPMLRAMEHIGQSAVMFRRYSNKQIDGYFISELHLQADGARYAVLRTDVLEAGDLHSEETRLKNLATRTYAYTVAEAAGPGFCVNGLMLNDRHDEEVGRFNFRSDIHKDMFFEIYTRALAKQDEGLFARVDRNREGAPLELRMAIHSLRKDRPRVAGMEAEELLDTFKEKGYRMLGFTVETRRDNPGYMRPQMKVELTAGGQIPGASDYVDSSLSNDNALLLWDKVVSSIRPRPDAVDGANR
ncbi:T6SS immunity protein Tli4 family protein [Cupriavidus taiwanensis]|uniref:T6SS immunity protein Tli4 family protein n=1 Tax=Cupriavidus taiwanensis TaxID=164546 RepID=UPI00254071A6|nr:T6SS immunity protein Tli4 family protein [Cupriavidus taiwanensis]MDK3026609.1 T6SS immunity protein Tli4 family protein [Cupriavidus taiwanensis]